MIDAPHVAEHGADHAADHAATRSAMAPWMPRARRGVGAGARLRPVGVAALVASGTAYTAVVDPNTSHAFPLCPLKFLTGLDCPACGCLRAVHSLAHGRIAEAADHNLLFTLAVPGLVVAWILWTVRSLRASPESLDGGPATRRSRSALPRWVWTATLVLVAAFTLARNLPFPLGHWLNSTA